MELRGLPDDRGHHARQRKQEGRLHPPARAETRGLPPQGALGRDFGRLKINIVLTRLNILLFVREKIDKIVTETEKRKISKGELF